MIDNWVERVPLVSTMGMCGRRFQAFLIAFICFVSVLPVALLTIGRFSFRTYFAVSFVWLLISSEVFAPADRESVWWSRLQWVKAGGWVVLVYILFKHVTMVLQ